MPASITHDLTFGWNDLSLVGTAHLPSGDGPHPVVLMLQGSGPADRDCGGYFATVRAAFLERRIATFAFDKPGCGASTGDWHDYGLEDRANQASSALEILRSHSAFDAEPVGIWGQSQGGWLVQILASRQSGLAFAIANSGPSITVAEQNLFGCEHTMRANGHDEAAIDQALAFVSAVHDAALDGQDYETVMAQVVDKVRDEPWYGSDLALDDPADWRFLQLLLGERYEPLEALAQVQCPFLAVYGGLDELVPAWRGAEESGRALHEAGNEDSTVVVFPSGDHRIQDSVTGRFVAGYLDLLGDWTAKRALRGLSQRCTGPNSVAESGGLALRE